MRERGKKEKERRDKHAREEKYTVGMKVLLKNKKRRKGEPLYDEDPYTITELVGRQATITRGSKTINRETEKFKPYQEKAPVEKAQKKPEAKDEWEEELSSLPKPRKPSTVAPEEQVGSEARTQDES